MDRTSDYLDWIRVVLDRGCEHFLRSEDFYQEVMYFDKSVGFMGMLANVKTDSCVRLFVYEPELFDELRLAVQVRAVPGRMEEVENVSGQQALALYFYPNPLMFG